MSHCAVSGDSSGGGEAGAGPCCGCGSAGSVDPPGRGDMVRLAIAAFLTMNVMVIALVTYLEPFGALDHAERLGLEVAMGLLALPVVFGAGSVFLREAVAEIRARAPAMSTLVSLGTTSAIAASIWALLTDGEVYFDSASMIIVYLLVGRIIEQSLTARAERAIRALEELVPDVAQVVKPCGVHARSVRAIHPGQVVRVAIGARVPVDGRILRGRSELDRSLLSGESEPVVVGTGDTVEAGVLNLAGVLEVEVTAEHGQRVIDGIARSVTEVRRTRPRLQRLADRFARGLVFVALGTALVSIVVSLGLGASIGDALPRAVATLVIACPCVAGLATPMALAIAASRGAAEGILYKDGDAFERLRTVDAVLVDKTGTLTTATPTVTQVWCAPGLGRADVLRTAAMMERGVLHPIARAIVDAAGIDEAEHLETQLVPGLGVEGVRDGARIRVGRGDWIVGHGVRPPSIGDPEGTVVHVAEGSRWLGAIELRSELRRGTEAAVAALREQGLRVVMLTGDRQAAARAVARRVGLPDSDVAYELRPQDKARFVRELQGQGRVVAFVGDGLNDGPALAAADVGVAVAEATPLAESSAHVVLRYGAIDRLPLLLRRARRAHAVMRGNVFFAVVYNLLALPLALAGVVTPATAAGLMALSSISVLGSSMRLRARGSSKDRSRDRSSTPSAQLLRPSGSTRSFS